MKIKWCSEIFKEYKLKSKKCINCNTFYIFKIYEYKLWQKQCYGIFYIFYRTAQLRFTIPRILKNLIKITKSINKDNEFYDDIPF